MAGDTSFGEKLREARKQRGLTQEQLRAKIGAGKNLLSGWETGAVLPEGVAALADVCRELGVSADWLLDLPTATHPEWVPEWIRQRLERLLAEIEEVAPRQSRFEQREPQPFTTPKGRKVELYPMGEADLVPRVAEPSPAKKAAGKGRRRGSR